MKMKKILAGILALTACFSFTSCSLFMPYSGSTGAQNNGGGLGNLGGGGNGGGATTIVSEKVANETAWRNAFDVDYNHYTVKGNGHYLDDVYDGLEHRRQDLSSEIVFIAKDNQISTRAIVKGTEGWGYFEEIEEHYYMELEGAIYEHESEYYSEDENGEYEEEIGEWELSGEENFAELKREILYFMDSREFSGIAQMYEEFSYDETEKVYIYEYNKENSVEDGGRYLELDEEMEKFTCKIWIKSGKVVKWYTELVEVWDKQHNKGRETEMIDIQFGVGEPNLPEFVMPEE